jgi:putative ABC transport system substrate-binding protein
VIYVSPGLLAKQVLRELEKSRKEIPVVVYTWDPVEEELVTNAARPGKDLTGVGFRPDVELVTKHLQLIKELIPRVNRIVYFLDPSWFLRNYTQQSRAVLEKAGRQMGIVIIPIEVKTPDRLEDAFSEAARKQPQAMIISGGPTFFGNRDRVTRLAANHRLPAIYDDELLAYAGGLISYGASIAEGQRQAAAMVAKILRGARPADTPVEYPTKFRLIVNLRAAAALGLEIPQTVLLQADEVIR